MDVFRFTPVGNPTLLDRAVSINGISSILWVERYREPGEFKIVAPVYSDLRKQLPLGSLISHVDTLEIMIVENHEIVEEKNSSPNIIVTGRSFESFLENRVVGSNFDPALPATNFLRLYSIGVHSTWFQARKLVNDHINVASVYDPLDGIDNVVCRSFIAISEPDLVGRTIERGLLHERLMTLLAIKNLGIRVIRPSNLSTFWGDPSSTIVLAIHKGQDKTDSVIFSWDSGDLEGAEYLWSTKKLKTSAVIDSRYVERKIQSPVGGLGNRMLHATATDLDQELSDPPTGMARIEVALKLDVRAKDILASSNDVTVTKANVSKNSLYQYRKDYNIGDLVKVDGNYDAAALMRISEYVEIQDEEGKSGYPTLSILDP